MDNPSQTSSAGSAPLLPQPVAKHGKRRFGPALESALSQRGVTVTFKVTPTGIQPLYGMGTRELHITAQNRTDMLRQLAQRSLLSGELEVDCLPDSHGTLRLCRPKGGFVRTVTATKPLAEQTPPLNRLVLDVPEDMVSTLKLPRMRLSLATCTVKRASGPMNVAHTHRMQQSFVRLSCTIQVRRHQGRTGLVLQNLRVQGSSELLHNTEVLGFNSYIPALSRHRQIHKWRSLPAQLDAQKSRAGELYCITRFADPVHIETMSQRLQAAQAAQRAAAATPAAGQGRGAAMPSGSAPVPAGGQVGMGAAGADARPARSISASSEI